jgi:hypothetical protein
MADDEKLWIQRNLQELAKAAALEVIQSQGGLSLPCQVIALNPDNPATGAPLGYSFVQVQFEVNVPYTKPDGSMGTYTLPPLILPKAEAQWLRAPTQVGDLGMTQALDTSHGGVSGMSAGVSDLGTSYGNLSTLVFVPMGNAAFGAIPDPQKAWVNGPAGTVSSDTAQTATHVVAVPTPGTPGSIASTIHNAAGAGATTVSHTLDGVANAITQALTNASGQVKTIVDGAGNAISHVVPTGGIVGIGALASSLSAARAIIPQADLKSAVEDVVNTSMVKLMATVGASMGSASGTWSTAQAQLNTIFSAATFVTNIPGILPTTPPGSAKARVSP